MPNRPSWKNRLRYSIDNTFSQGTLALIAWLGILSIVIILIAALVLTLTGVNQEGVQGPLTFSEAVWESLMRTLDAGTMGGDTGWGFRFVMLLLPTLGGIFIISTFIGVLTSGIESKVEELRKGRSRVIEENHTVILGWNEQVFTIVSELITANENQKKPCIVILGEKDKIEMEDELREKIENFKNTRIVCRSGNPMEMADLELVSPETSRSIIVLSPGKEDPDAEVIKIILAIVNHPLRRKLPYHIVAELHNPKNQAVARVAGKGEVEWIQVNDLVARIVAQTCRQSGLSAIYNDLLDFGGDEIYLTRFPEFVGKPFGQCLSAFEKNAVLGIALSDGTAQLNPGMDVIIQAEDQLILIAEDDDKIIQNGNPLIQMDQIITHRESTSKPEHTLILGWNQRCPAILQELDQYTSHGSTALILSQYQPDQIETQLANQKMEVRVGDPTDRETLESLPLSMYDHIIVLSDSDRLLPQEADARTLFTLLHLRDLADQSGLKFSIVSEMMDIRNRNLADVTRADDFIVSDRLISLILSQVSENKALNPIFKDLFDPEGSEIYLKNAGEYIVTDQPVNFYTVLESARLRGELAIGYRQAANAGKADQAYGIVLNPAKSIPVTFKPQDKIIVIAEE